MGITADVWVSLAIQIPVVLLFCVFMGYIVKLFLDHINASEARAQTFIKEQRESNNAVIKALGEDNREALKEMSQAFREETNTICGKLGELLQIEVGHDAFVRTSFKERFGATITGQAEQASLEAQSKIQRER